MIELRSADLRFRPAETLAFLRQNPDLTIDEAAVTVLDEAVEGWPAGLRLATLSLRLSDDPGGHLGDLSPQPRLYRRLSVQRDSYRSAAGPAGISPASSAW